MLIDKFYIYIRTIYLFTSLLVFSLVYPFFGFFYSFSRPHWNGKDELGECSSTGIHFEATDADAQHCINAVLGLSKLTLLLHPVRFHSLQNLPFHLL